MLDVFVILLAILLIILGARGTYQSIWNSIFPSTPITTQLQPGMSTNPSGLINSAINAATSTSQNPSGIVSQVTQAANNGNTMLPISGNPIGVVPGQVN